MTDAEQAPFPVPENTVSSAADAIAALLSGNPNATRDPADVEEEAERPAAFQSPEPAAETEAQPEAVEAQPEDTAQSETEAVAENAEQPEPVAQEAKAATPAPSEVKTDPKIAAEDETLAQLNNLVPQLEAALAISFPEIKTRQDLINLGRQDVNRYNEYQLISSQLADAKQAQSQLAANKQHRVMQEQVAILRQQFPDYVDPAKHMALRAELSEYAKKRGFSEERMQSASAAEIIALRDLMRLEKLQSQQAKKPVETAKAIAQAKDKAAKAPPVQKPGVARDDDKNQRVQDSYKRLQQTGHVNDAAEVFKRIGVV